MSVHVTLRVFSGRRNPRWMLSAQEVRQLRVFLEPVGRALPDSDITLMCQLCYDGYEIDTRDEPDLPPMFRVRGGAIAPDRTGDTARVAAIEHFLLTTAEARQAVSPAVALDVNRRIERLRDHQCPPAPPPRESRFSEEPLLSEANCYNYAADTPSSDHFPGVPGASAHKPVPNEQSGSCQAVLKAALLDKLTVKPSGASGEIQVALVVNPDVDFHWYRRHGNGLWSHKYSGDPPRDFDEDGKLISDPRSCARACYTEFCGFYYADPKKVRLRSA